MISKSGAVGLAIQDTTKDLIFFGGGSIIPKGAVLPPYASSYNILIKCIAWTQVSTTVYKCDTPTARRQGTAETVYFGATQPAKGLQSICAAFGLDFSSVVYTNGVSGTRLDFDETNGLYQPWEARAASEINRIHTINCRLW